MPATGGHFFGAVRVISANLLTHPDLSTAKRHGIGHEATNLRAGERARGAIHLDHVNGWHSRFERWLVRFRSVASRYLVHYSGWRRVLDAGEPAAPFQLLVTAVKAD